MIMIVGQCSIYCNELEKIMWNEIADEKCIQNFMNKVGFFHDSCIKEMHYYSGAYVDDNLAMYPTNDKRILNIIIQRQFEELSMIELQFIGLKSLNLFPTNEEYTCEILDSKMFIKDGFIYWCDCEEVSEDDFEDYEGTLISASKLGWRAIESKMGKEEFYVATM